MRDPLREPIWSQVALLNRRDDGEGKVRLPGLALVELVGVPVNVSRWRGGQPDMESVEMRQRRLPRAVDGPMALVGNHDVEVAAGELLVAPDHRLEQANGDLLVLNRHACLQPIAAVIRTEVLQRPNCLLGQLLPVHQEEQPLRPPSLEHPLRVEADNVRLASAGRQFHQEPALPQLHRMVERPQHFLLVGPDNPHLPHADEIVRNRHRGQRLGFLPQVNQSLQVAPGVEGTDDAGIVVLVIPEVGQLPVREEDEGRADALGRSAVFAPWPCRGQSGHVSPPSPPSGRPFAASNT